MSETEFVKYLTYKKIVDAALPRLLCLRQVSIKAVVEPVITKFIEALKRPL